MTFLIFKMGLMTRLAQPVFILRENFGRLSWNVKLFCSSAPFFEIVIFYLTMPWSNQTIFYWLFKSIRFKVLMKLFFLVATVAMITEKLPFFYFYRFRFCEKNPWRNNAAINQKWSQTDTEFSKKLSWRYIPFSIFLLFLLPFVTYLSGYYLFLKML